MTYSYAMGRAGEGAKRRPGPPTAEGERRAVLEAIERLVRADRELQGAAEVLAGLVDDTADAFARPNLRRALDQVRTAVNAAEGARRRLRRRLALHRSRGTDRPLAPPKD
jgi:hypothetical protein